MNSTKAEIEKMRYWFCRGILADAGFTDNEAIEYIGMNGIDTVYELLKKEIEG